MSNNVVTRGPEFEFVEGGSLLFISGAPMSGKSAISPQIGSAIEGCSLQNMDIFRLLVGRENEKLPNNDRNPVLQYGSCDSYLAIGDGEYSEDALIEGYVMNAAAICAPLDYVIPKLEIQGAQNMLFEGVQLLPSLVNKFIRSNINSRYIVVTTSTEEYEARRELLYQGDGYEFGKKYTADRLKLIEDRIVDETQLLPEGAVCVLDNSSSSIEDVVGQALVFLSTSGLIVQKQ